MARVSRDREFIDYAGVNNFQNWDFDTYYIYPRFKGPVKTKADYMTAPGIKRTG